LGRRRRHAPDTFGAVPVTVASGSAFDAEQRRRLEVLERTHFWFAARAELVHTSMERHGAQSPVLDVGCGTGRLVGDLRERGWAAFGVDAAGTVDVNADALVLPVADSSVATVLLLDVVEHLDDRRAVAEARRVLAPDGLLVVAVPAHPWLWSARDSRAGHRRRYRRGDLASLLAVGGFAIDRIVGFQLALLPAAAVSRLVLRGRPDVLGVEDAPPRVASALMRSISRAELAVGRHLALPTGMSYFAIARRR
jgi:SAM-dependent methyltransferase